MLLSMQNNSTLLKTEEQETSNAISITARDALESNLMLTRCRVLSLGYLESVLHRQGIRQTPHAH